MDVDHLESTFGAWTTAKWNHSQVQQIETSRPAKQLPPYRPTWTLKSTLWNATLLLQPGGFESPRLSAGGYRPLKVNFHFVHLSSWRDLQDQLRIASTETWF